MSALEISGLRKVFGGVVALDGVTLSIGLDQILGIVGPNGSGKTTLFNVVTGVHKPTAGRVTWQGEDITGRPAHEIARRGLVRTLPAGDVVSRPLGPRERAHRQRARPRSSGGRRRGGGTSPRRAARRSSGSRAMARRAWPARCRSATCAGSGSRWRSRRSRAPAPRRARRRPQRHARPRQLAELIVAASRRAASASASSTTT